MNSATQQRMLDCCLLRIDRQQRGAAALGWLGPACAVGLGAATAGVLLIKLAWPTAAPVAGMLAAAGTLLPLCWWPPRCRRRATRERLAAHLDHALGGSGLAMAVAAAPADGARASWLDRLHTPLAEHRPDPLPWRRLWPALLPAACLAVALAIPPRELRPTPAVAAARFLEPTQQRLDAAVQEELLPEDEAERLKEQLSRLQQEAQQAMTPAVWQGLDQVDQRLDSVLGAQARQMQAAARAAQQAAAGNAQASAALAAHLADLQHQAERLGLDRLDPQTAAELAQQLAQGAQLPSNSPLAQALAKARAAGAADAKNGSIGTPKPAPLTAAQRQSRSQALRELSQRLQQQSQCSSGHCRGNKPGDGQGLGQGQPGDQGDFDPQMADGNSGGDLTGNGGVSRGPGAAALNKTRVGPRIEPGQDAGLTGAKDPDQPPGELLRQLIREPEADQAAIDAGARRGAAGDQAATADARRAAIAVRHRAAIAGYFGTNPQPDPTTGAQPVTAPVLP